MSLLVDGAMGQIKCNCSKGKHKTDALSKLLRLDEDVKVGFLQLLCKHAEYVRSGGEISKIIHDQVEQQLQQMSAI